MTVYVDEPKYRYHRMIMCHMIADTEEELHDMADTIGVSRSHFQDHNGRPHYDICKSKRALAVKAGAVTIDTREMIKILRGDKR